MPGESAMHRGSLGGRRGLGPLLGLGATLLTLAPDAAAYCRTAVCAGEVVGKICDPPEPDDCGIALFWSKRCVGYSVQEDASVRVPWDVANGIVDQAFATWAAAPCGGGAGPTMEGVNLGPVQCDAREYNQSGGNANVIVFRDDRWPYAGQWNTLALTTVTYNLDSGEIYDADLEINSADVALTWGDDDVQYDLPSIVTHEVGHVFGLAHSEVADSTMFSDYEIGRTSLRDLAADDVDGICQVYPPGPPRSTLECDPTPRHGFKTDCGPGPVEEEGGCYLGVARGHSRFAGGLFGVALLAGLLARRRLLRRPRRTPPYPPSPPSTNR